MPIQFKGLNPNSFVSEELVSLGMEQSGHWFFVESNGLSKLDFSRLTLKNRYINVHIYVLTFISIICLFCSIILRASPYGCST